MNTFLFVEQSPNPLAVKFVFKEPFLQKDALILDKSIDRKEAWIKPFWDLDYLQQIYIAQNFVIFIHKPFEKKLDSHVSPWAEKVQEIQNLLEYIPFPLDNEKVSYFCEDKDLVSIQAWLDRFIRKATWIHGGAFQAVKLEDGVLFLRPDGACYQCPYLGMTVYKGILEPLSSAFPQVQNIQLTYDFLANS
ncbi:MAG: hypothetical protein KatS3mg035_0480 [Bacteroidia bacterium]|jgi:Fe-S cluster biogenesis protein NfuA|nr:MAG: hypothetical protein KatS3mg035_0480 [Bacteroidia bacterium]